MPIVPFDERSRPGLYKLALPASESWRVVLYRGGMNWGCTLYTASELPDLEGPGKDRNLPQCQTRDTKSDGLCKVCAKGQHGCKPD